VTSDLSKTGQDPPARDPLGRLTEAVDLYLAHRDVSASEAAAGGSSATRQRLLAERPDLADLLEPLFGSGAPSGDSAADDEASSPRWFGDFELIREVGRGGMGVVYEAREAPLDRRVALKVMPDGPLTTLQVERFRREAAAAGRLHHRGIAAVFRVGEHGGTHFIAMEFVDGDNLAAVIARRIAEGVGTDSGWIHRVTDIVAAVAEALSYAHEHGVVHRDIKPHNIVLASSGEVRVVDFGLAKDFGRDSVTQTGESAGTPDYMSPEQVRGGVVDGRSDVFSLGAVLYELLTLQRPFAGSNLHETLSAILNRSPSPPNAIERRVSRDLATVCMKALEKEPAARYGSMAAFARDLRHVQHGEAIEASPPTAWVRLVKTVRRHPAASLAALFAILAIVVAPLSFAWYYKLANDRIAAEQRETARQRDRLAEQQRETARQRDLVSSVLHEARDTLDEIADLSDPDAGEDRSGFRRDVLESIVAFYESVRDAAEGDSSLRTDAAHAEERLGTLLEVLYEPERAERHLRAAVAALDSIVDERSGLPSAASRAASARRRLGRFLTNQNRATEGRAELSEAIAMFERALADPELDSEPGARRSTLVEAARAYLERADLDIDSARYSESAGADFARATELFDAIPERDRQDVLTLIVAGAYGSRSEWRASQGDRDGARADLETVLELIEPFAGRKELTARRHLLSLARRCGRIQDQLGDLEAAKASFRRAIDLADRLASQYPTFVSHRHSAGGARFDLGVARARSGNLEAALDVFEEAREIAREIIVDTPSSLQAISLFANTTAAVSTVRMELGQSEAGIETIENAVAMIEPYVERQPDSLALSTELGTFYCNLSFACSGAGRKVEARDAAARAFELQTRGLETQPGNANIAHLLSISAERLLRAEIDLGNPRGGVRAAEVLAELSPDDGPRLCIAAETFLRAAAQAREESDAEAAKGYEDRAERCFRRVAEFDEAALEKAARVVPIAEFLRSRGLR
jgi:tetratricopeptide (TPR) repeat protein/predicted Ser/Thr protein kinase